MKNVIIIGGGITGLAMAKLLNNEYNVIVLEKENMIGGIAKTLQINDIAYHTVGGHCFNSKYKEVLDFVFNLMPIEEWNKIRRVSRINFGDYEVDYPIEFSVNQIYNFNKDVAYEITKDFLSTNDDFIYSNLEEWFRKKFGDTLSELYFLPYNKKIWGKNPIEMSYEWVQDKLPQPDKLTFFKSLLEPQYDSMPHQYFYYPKSNNQISFINSLGKGLKIFTNKTVFKIEKRNNKWIVNDIYETDILISTIPLNILPQVVSETPIEVIDAVNKLKYNKVTNMLWESHKTDKTWTYQPLKDTIFHRYIHIGNFNKPNKNYTITEVIGEHSFEDMVAQGEKDPFLIKPISYNVSDHAYIIFDENRSESLSIIQKYIDSLGLFSIGRFGQWEYFNMDVCIKQCIDLYNNKFKVN